MDHYLLDTNILYSNLTQTTATPAANQICVYGSTAKTCTPTTTLPTAAIPTIPLTSIAAVAANTTLANVTSGSAAPTAATIPAGIQNYVSGTGYSQATGHQIQVPIQCADSSGSGTAQSCTTSPTFTPASPDCMTYTTTTTSSGTGLTVNWNSLGAKSVAIAGASGWTTTLTASIIPANKPMLACYDGTNIDVMQTGTAASGGGISTLTGSGLTLGNTYYMNGATITAAEANASTTLPAVCVASSTIACTFNGVVTGLSGLTAGAVYYVSDGTAGAITATAPSTSGHYVQVIGVATSTTSLLVMPSLNYGGIQ